MKHRRQLGFPVCLSGLVDKVIDEMTFDDSAHQTVDRAANGGDLLEDLDTVALFIQLTLQCLRLSLNATHTCQQFALVSNGMHGLARSWL